MKNYWPPRRVPCARRGCLIPASVLHNDEAYCAQDYMQMMRRQA